MADEKRAAEEQRNQRNFDKYCQLLSTNKHLRSIPTTAYTPLKRSCSNIEIFYEREPRCVLEISRLPINCPQCHNIISPSAIMQHFVTQHIEFGPVRLVELYEGQRFVDKISPIEMKFSKNNALTLYAYGGLEGKPQRSLISRKLALPNVKMLGRYNAYSYHSPILLMGCRTSWAACLGNREFEKAMAIERSEEDDIWIFWMLTAELVRPLYITLTAFDKLMSESRSRTISVRNTSQSQHCYDFILKDFNHLMLKYEDVKSMTHNFKFRLRLEVMVDPYVNNIAPSVEKIENSLI